MKTKFIIRLASIMIMPAFFSLFISMLTSVENWNDKDVNYPFAFWCAVVGLLSFAFIITSYGTVWRYVSKLDKLDEVEQEYLTAKREMETARDAYTELIKQK